MSDMRWFEWVLLASLMVLIVMAEVRPVGAEDDCAIGTWRVERAFGTLWCVLEPL